MAKQPTVAFHRLASGEWAVAGPPNDVYVGDVEVLTKDGKIEHVKVLKTSPILRTRSGKKFRVGYLQPVIFNPETLIANIEHLTEQIARQQKTLDKLNNRLARLITAVRRQMVG